MEFGGQVLCQPFGNCYFNTAFLVTFSSEWDRSKFSFCGKTEASTEGGTTT